MCCTSDESGFRSCEEPERLGAGIGGFVGAAVVDMVLRVSSKEANR